MENCTFHYMLSGLFINQFTYFFVLSFLLDYKQFEDGNHDLNFFSYIIHWVLKWSPMYVHCFN